MAHYEQGRYTCELTTHGIDKSKAKGTPYVFLNFHPIDNGVVGDYERQVRLWLTDKTSERTIDRLRSLGWDGDRFADLANHSFRGERVELECSHNAEGYEDWDFPYTPTESSEVEVDGEVAKKLDALFGRQLKRSASTTRVNDEEVEVGSVEDDDGIPF